MVSRSYQDLEHHTPPETSPCSRGKFRAATGCDATQGRRIGSNSGRSLSLSFADDLQRQLPRTGTIWTWLVRVSGSAAGRSPFAGLFLFRAQKHVLASVIENAGLRFVARRDQGVDGRWPTRWRPERSATDIQDLRCHSVRPSDRKSRSPPSTVASAAILAIATNSTLRITDALDLTSVRAGRIFGAPCATAGNLQPLRLPAANPASLQMPHRLAR